MPSSLIPVRRWRHPTLIALLALTLGACAVGPDFQSPADEAADDYQVRAPTGAICPLANMPARPSGRRNAEWSTRVSTPGSP